MSTQKDKKKRLREKREAAESADLSRTAHRKKLKIAGIGAALLLAAGVLGVGLSTSSSNDGEPVGSATPLTASQLAELPKELAANDAQANQVVDGSITDKLSGLRGVPVVVNQWASWCPNCVSEFPLFQQASEKLKGKVAFVGLDSQDDRGDAEAFLKDNPAIYPSIFDDSASQAGSIGGGQGWPTTIFFNKLGQRTYVHQGGYTTLDTLQADIQSYALAKHG